MSVLAIEQYRGYTIMCSTVKKGAQFYWCEGDNHMGYYETVNGARLSIDVVLGGLRVEPTLPMQNPEFFEKSKRLDEFAKAAMNGILARPSSAQSHFPGLVASLSYDMAEAMEEQRAKRLAT